MVGRIDDPNRQTVTAGGMSYRVSVSGAAPVGLGGVVAGSNVFGLADTSGGLEFGDDITDTVFQVGASLGFVDVRGQGNYADITLTVTGDVGYITGDAAATDDGDYAEFEISGNFDRLETRNGDLQFNFIDVGGNLAELECAGVLGDPTITVPAAIDVGGHVGSLTTGGDFFAALSVYGEGVDLFYVGGDFGSTIVYSRLDTAPGTDVAFAHVVGDIYDEGDFVYPVPVNNRTADFADDGGSMLHLTPVSTRFQSVGIGFDQHWEHIPATLSYRYLPIGQTQPWGAVGAVITEITASDSLLITVDSGAADLSYVTLGNNTTSYLKVVGRHRLAELDIFQVNALAFSTPSIVNKTHQGDIVNVNARSVGRIFASGHIGLTDRFAPEAGRLPNPTPGAFVPPAVTYVSADPSLSNATAGSVSEERARYFNGVFVRRDIARIEANGSIGDVYVGGNVGFYRADADRAPNGTGFVFRGEGRGDREWDGTAGVLYAGGDIGFADPGDGILGFVDRAGLHSGQGGVPVGGIFAGGVINRVSARGATIEGPIFGSGGIRSIVGRRTTFHEATIGAGADFSDWALWDESNQTTEGVRLDNMRLSGAGGGIDSSLIQVGVLGSLYLGPRTDGWRDSHIWAIGDPASEEGINRITVLGGGMDGTGAPPYHSAFGPDIETNQRIGSITLRGRTVDMENMSIRTLKSINSISVQGDIIFDVDSTITAPFFINSISADDVKGGAALYVGTGELGRLLVRGDFEDEAEVHVDGPVQLLSVNGAFDGDFTTVGPHGSVERLIAGLGLSGDVDASNYIGSVNVRRGDLSGDIRAGGSNENNLAIGRIIVRRGDLKGTVDTFVNEVALRPGGGIGGIIVRGEIGDDITTTSYYDVARANQVTADIGLIRVTGGDIDGNITIQQNDPGNPNDPGGTLRRLILRGGDLNGDVTIAGDIGQLLVRDGVINGSISVDGSDVQRMVVVADGGSAITRDIDIDGDLGFLKIVGGDFAGDLSVGGTLGTLSVASGADMLGTVTAGEINKAVFRGSLGVTAPVTVQGHIGRLVAREGTGPGGTITAGDGIDLLLSYGDVQGDVTVTAGGVGTIRIQGGDMEGNLSVEEGRAQNIQIFGGGLTAGGSINVADELTALRIQHRGETAIGGNVVVGDYLGRALLTGDVASDFTVGDGELGDGMGVLRLRGDLAADLAVEGDVNQMSIIGGQVSSNDSAEPRIYVSGDVNGLKVFGFAGAGAVIDDDVRVIGKLGYFLVRDGNFDGTIEAGSIGTLLYNTPDGITAGHEVISHGNLDLLRVPSGPIAAAVDVYHHVGTILAQGGVSAEISAGSGFPGSGLDSLVVSGGELSGSVNVNGNLSRVMVRGSMVDGALNVTGGDLGSFTAQGSLIRSEINVGDGALDNLMVRGDYTDSTVFANSLRRVTVRGDVSDTDALLDEIHAATGRFDLFVAGVRHDIHDDDGEWFDGVHAYVG